MPKNKTRLEGAEFWQRTLAYNVARKSNRKLPNGLNLQRLTDAEAERLANNVWAAVKKLPDPLRQAVLLRYAEQMTYKAMAEKLALTQSQASELDSCALYVLSRNPLYGLMFGTALPSDPACDAIKNLAPLRAVVTWRRIADIAEAGYYTCRDVFNAQRLTDVQNIGPETAGKLKAVALNHIQEDQDETSDHVPVQP